MYIPPFQLGIFVGAVLIDNYRSKKRSEARKK